jgi:tetratricopeptide (TPR) repeat protein
MQRTAATRAASGACAIGEIAINGKQQMMEGGVSQQVLIHGWFSPPRAPTSMAKPAPKPGRNDPCHCGSGNKYKKCCLAKDQAAERAAADRLKVAEFKAAVAARMAGAGTEDADKEDALDAASNAVVDLVHAARFGEAEAAARDLLRRFPDVHDGWDRLGMVHEARGDNRQAADCYRKVIDFIRRHPNRYDRGMLEQFARLVAKLDSARRHLNASHRSH